MKSLAILLLALGTAIPPLFAQDVYRVVDEDGNVTYTDQKPDDDARPIDLPELNVLEGEDDAEEVLVEAEEETPPGSESEAELDFRIEQPADGATLEGNMVEVAMDIAIEVPPTAEIVLMLDGQALEPIRTLTTTLAEIEAGEHRLYARLQTPSGLVIGTTEAVDFTVTDGEGTSEE